MSEKLTPEYVRERFNYYPATGVLTWRTNVDRTVVGKPVGSLGNHGYLVVNVLDRPVLLHRLIWLHVHGREPVEQIDHVNRVRTDNRICNLREASFSQQLMNQGMRSDNTSGFKGVFWDKSRMKYQARISVNCRDIYLGRFECLEDAVACRREAEKRYFGEFSSQAA